MFALALWYGKHTKHRELKTMAMPAKLSSLKSLIKRERLDVWQLLPNGLYQAFLDPKLGKDKMRFYWNPKMNPLSPPRTYRDFSRLMNEDFGGEVFYLKNQSNVIFINYWKSFAVFYSLDKQKLLFRNNLKSLYFHKL